MSYERPQNNNDPNANWTSEQGGQGADPNVAGEQPVRDGGPKGNVYDPSAEPPRYGVRVPESERGSQYGQGPYQAGPQGQGGQGGQPWNSGPQQTDAQSWNNAQSGPQSVQNQYGAANHNPYGPGQVDYYAAANGPSNNQNPYDQPYVAPPVTPGRGLAIAAVVLGSISIVLFFLGLTVLLALLGLIFAIVALVKARKVQGSRKGLGITGLVLNIIGLVLGTIALIFWVVIGGMAWTMFQDPAVQECISQYMDDQNQTAYQQCLEDNLPAPGQNS
ncbi:DUF4190 domain-containing protein [Kocuria sp.]|uniref:DUF4190 domain-containing protein n=1 Tax=Kocuria sp. TaxID=1871328 RepID=UPI0026DED789|nr:DUF4190 domain-containing protein [Kocuria sp.]MDO5619792.1 DUF4190 domain-containing protein [Kocuria sp.]